MGRVWPVHSGNSLTETRWQMEGTKKNDRGDRGDRIRTRLRHTAWGHGGEIGQGNDRSASLDSPFG